MRRMKASFFILMEGSMAKRARAFARLSGMETGERRERNDTDRFIFGSYQYAYAHAHEARTLARSPWLTRYAPLMPM